MTRFLKILFATLLLSASASNLAHAQARTFVASFGTDANACTVAAPCRTLQRGIDVVAAGGDVLIVDSGAFGGNVVINKSVSVLTEPGSRARVRPLSNNDLGLTLGLLIDGADIAVSISGLGVTGDPVPTTGIFFRNGRSLSLTGMDINVPGQSNGIYHGAGNGHLTLSNSTIRGSESCFFAFDLSGMTATRSTITNSRIENCVNGIEASARSTVAVVDTTVTGSLSSCVINLIARSTSSNLVLENVTSTGCEYGVKTETTNANISVSNSMFTGNTFAGAATGTGAKTFGNNRIFGNGTDALTGFTSIAEQ